MRHACAGNRVSKLRSHLYPEKRPIAPAAELQRHFGIAASLPSFLSCVIPGSFFFSWFSFLPGRYDSRAAKESGIWWREGKGPRARAGLHFAVCDAGYRRASYCWRIKPSWDPYLNSVAYRKCARTGTQCEFALRDSVMPIIAISNRHVPTPRR